MQPPTIKAANGNSSIPDEVLERFVDKYHGPAPGPGAAQRLERILRMARLSAAQASLIAEQWRESDPVGFFAAVRHVLRTCPDEGEKELLRSMVTVEELLRALADPGAFHREDAVGLARELQRHAPDVDVRLAKRFSVERGHGEDTSEAESVQRTLELIEAVACSERILPFLVRACRTTDYRIISKIALVAGRCAWGRGLVARLLEDSEPRVRANAIEGLWESGHFEDKREMLWRAAKDAHHRVVVNALVGLARAGEQGAQERLEALAEHPSQMFRAAAAWGMGELRDPRFQEVLTRMYQKETGNVRQNALRALVRLRKAAAGGEPTAPD